MQAEIIKNIKFGIFSQEQIKKLSVAKLTVPDTYNEDGYPIDGGLLDQRLGVIDPGLVCKTCGGRAKICPGHFGHIELVRPVIHSEFAKILNMLMQATCQKCHRVLLNEEQLAGFKAELSKELKADAPATETPAEAPAVEETVAEKHENKQSMLKKIKTIKKCPYCETVQEKLKFSMPTYFYLGERRLKPDEIKDMLAKISTDDLDVLGIDSTTSRPEALILNALLVPPVDVRPSITLETGERSEDDLTHKLVDIMRINQRLEQNINAGAPQIIIDDLWELLQYHVTTYFNNETSGIPPARHRSGRALKTIAQRLKGKEGRFRYNLSGKRVNYSARTVISVDPNIDVDEVGIPRAIAEKMTLPFYITEWNIEEARRLLQRKEYPLVVNMIAPDGKRKRILEANKEELLKDLKPGYILERQLQDGDLALFNRQPSLHRISIMAHRIRVLPGKTFRITYCASQPYNADCDGDEMNLHIPQTLEAQAEAKYLMEVKDQIFSPRDGNAIIANGEDGISGLYLLTQDSTYLDKHEVEFLLSKAGIRELPKASKNGMYKGKDVFSMLLPKGLDFESESAGEKFIIKNGVLVEGVVAKKTYGLGNKLFIAIAVAEGTEMLSEFLSKSSRLAYASATMHGVTIGVKDYEISEAAKKDKSKLVAETLEKISNLIEQYKTKKLEPLLGLTQRQSLEQHILAECEIARAKGIALLSKNADKSNFAMVMSSSGARASMLNLEQMSLFLAQQATLNGGRISRGYYTKRVIPHIDRNDFGALSRGFVTSSYLDGLTPIEMAMHAIAGRGAVMQKGLLTQRSGYLYRRLANAMLDYYVLADNSVRDVNNNMIETIYGGDAIDPTKVNFPSEEKKG